MCCEIGCKATFSIFFNVSAKYDLIKKKAFLSHWENIVIYLVKKKIAGNAQNVIKHELRKWLDSIGNRDGLLIMTVGSLSI